MKTFRVIIKQAHSHKRVSTRLALELDLHEIQIS